MHSESERELAHILLVELLAHQFAYPVRWIETQNAILDEFKAERIVEVGPTNILTNMMKRTWRHKNEVSDEVQGLRRRILDPEADLSEIYYQIGVPETAEADAETPDMVTIGNLETCQDDSLSTPQLQSISHSEVKDIMTVEQQSQFEDASLPVSAVVLTLIATKLKKPRETLDQTKSINQLVTVGRSTLANEIIGDLHTEFPNQLPDRAEEQRLVDLFEVLRKGHTGTLGKKTSALVANFISAKLPGSFSQSRVRDHLGKQFGLGPMRQDAVLLLALAERLDARLASEDAARTFFDEITTIYLKQEGLSLPSKSSSSATGKIVQFDQKALEVLNERSNELLHDINAVILQHLPESSMNSTENSKPGEDKAVLDELDLWRSEHGENYAEGIKPIFDIRKQRFYDSYWNWCSRDIALLFDLAKEPRSHNAALIEELTTSIINRTCERSIAQIQYLCSKTHGEKNYLGRIMRFCLQASISSKSRDPVFMDNSPDLAPLTTIDDEGNIKYCEIQRNQPAKTRKSSIPQMPYSVGTYDHGTLTMSDRLTSAYAEDIDAARHSGFTFRGRNILLTGAGQNSIGFSLLKYLLQGGGRVTVTTSTYSPDATRMYQAIYSRHGAKDSALRVLPFNQGSQKDVKDLSNHLIDEWDPDFIIPFAAISENGRDLEGLDSKSEIAHRLMLTNLLRLLGAIARNKRSRGITTRPATVVLPLSPNHGLMGNDGLYAESKRGLESLLSKWKSETWGDYLSMLGVIIGWTRGTGLMDENDIVAEGVENMGARTFSKDQMAALIATLLGGRINVACQSIPLVIDIGGGLGKVVDLKEKLTAIRRDLRDEADIRRAIMDEERQESTITGYDDVSQKPKLLSPKANIRIQLPTLPDWDRDLSPLAVSLEGMVDLSRTVVITGFAELGPCGNSRTRWEMEAHSVLSVEGCIEMAWMMGLIKHDRSIVYGGQSWSGWIDTKTKEPVEESDIFPRYMGLILEHTGIRKIEPAICDNKYDPERKTIVQEVELTKDLPPFESSSEVAQYFKLQHGVKAVISETNSGLFTVQLKAGSKVLLPKSSAFNRTVAGQIPTGWSAKRYGIEDDIIEQVDPVTLFSLVCTVEALLSSGIVDPYELYEHIHLSEVGNCIGSSMGGLSSLRRMHRDRFLDKPVQGDILQETFINTTGAWINMLLTSSTGPIKTPVGACATSLESLDTGYDLIVAGKAKVCIVGGVEDFVEDVSYEFGSMNATCDTDKEFAAGRSPAEMSRPTAASRSGFVESQGCGIQILTTAELALEMGLPIFGVVAHTSMAADRVGRSVPAPGRGVLTNARESNLGRKYMTPSPLLDMGYRRRLLNMRLEQVNDNFQTNLDLMEHEIRYIKEMGTEGFDEEQYRRDNIATFDDDLKKQEADLRFALGNNFWKSEKQIAPIRGSLATWGLGIDDLTVASMHGTSTVKNDLNEASVLQEQIKYLGRQEGNLLPCVCQKWLTGHSKGAAGAWMLNGALQMMDSGLIPGNRNADNIDTELRQYSLLHFPNMTIKSEDIKACSVTSFGFGQKGSQAILVHPKFLFATVSSTTYHDYGIKRNERSNKANRHFNYGLLHERIVNTKTSPPYQTDGESEALLDPVTRFFTK
ncbi:fatty acid synthase subunit alpha reductase [Colletotrichum truncatum]|uniref:Fatty acid synthase subunit alpha reductase n=1 Tax=Colletotrichum truncatum TaxID=5467 RepID=A0ACC3YVC1_COLTU|nr:fatty acid synthase subunit alpha reductase [Colletotrichum truncatum]KAF6781594.1 fatty acid synthase subunit alpha reductase [Colletotrichum truncatum]